MDTTNPTSIPDIVAQIDLFTDAPSDALATAIHLSTRRKVPAKAFFFRQEEPATSCYVLLTGRVRLTQLTPEGHQVVIRYMGPGDGLGIIVALTGTPYPLTAATVTDCTALAWSATAVTHLVEQYPRLALNAMRMVAHHFQALQRRYVELATERVERRVARALLRLARQTGKRVDAGVLLDLPLSRQDLGEMTGTTLYTISRILSQWEQNGIIKTGRERVIICEPHRLVTIAEDLPDRPRDPS